MQEEKRDSDARLALLEDAMGRCERRISRHGEEIDELKLNREHDSVMLANVNATCLDIRAKLDAQEQKFEDLGGEGGRRWETVVNTVIQGVTSALLLYVIYRLGLGH